MAHEETGMATVTVDKTTGAKRTAEYTCIVFDSVDEGLKARGQDGVLKLLNEDQHTNARNKAAAEIRTEVGKEAAEDSAFVKRLMACKTDAERNKLIAERSK